MRKLALTILTISVVSAAGHIQAQTYDPAFPVCMSFLGEAALTINAATKRWTNAGRRQPVRCAASIRITLVRGLGTAGGIIAR